MTVETGLDTAEGGVRADEPTVLVEDVVVRFPRRVDPALQVGALQLARGEQVLVVGPSGGGKSTLLQTLSGVVPLSVHSTMTGRVEVCGSVTSRTTVAELSRHVATVAQDPAAGLCLPYVDQELALVLENRAVPGHEIDDLVATGLARVGAGHLRARRTHELSGGEAQRVAVAAALVAGPDVLLMDEPTAMLDDAGVAVVREALAGAASPGGPTVVVVEHRLDELAGAGGLDALPGRVVVLDGRGTVVADGPTPETLYARSSSLRSAGCWLPLEVELAAWTAVAGGLAAEANQELLRRLGRQRTPDGRGRDLDGGGPVLSARGLSVARGRAAPVLTDVDLDLVPGEVVALAGPNGSGKSSLLLTLAGLLRAGRGRVSGPRPGLVFQNAEHQFVAHTVADEVRYGLPPGSDRLAARQLCRHRLAGLGSCSPYRLSGGEKRRLNLAAMLAHDRRVLLLDEPTLGLDRRDTVATTAVLRDAANEGRAVLFASHDLRTVATLSDRLVLLGDGGMLADGPTLDVLADDGLLRRARLELPPLVRWLIDHVGSHDDVRAVLRGLDAGVEEER